MFLHRLAIYQTPRLFSFAASFFNRLAKHLPPRLPLHFHPFAAMLYFPHAAIICHCSALSRPSVRPTNHPTKTHLGTWRCICATVCRYICATVCRCTNAFVCRYMRPQNMFQQICIAFAQYSAQTRSQILTKSALNLSSFLSTCV